MDRIVSRHKLTWSPLQEKIPEENTIKSVPPATAVSKDSVEDLRNQIIELKATLSTRNEDTNRSRESHNTKYRAYCLSSSHDLRECYKENRLQVTASIVVDLNVGEETSDVRGDIASHPRQIRQPPLNLRLLKGCVTCEQTPSYQRLPSSSFGGVS